ncbi:LysR family transcriptional regulator [Streptomyces sp. NPDC049954]|uniref:LysR family transcriptional regulator n=1 Tax=Streptomyces sp. NPDC049954 TaxID=3155779 RepID=UPI00343F00B5
MPPPPASPSAPASPETLEIRHLRCFLAIAEERSVTGAAARLGVGQPAVSRTLAQLERALGLRLVDRSTHHLVLTAEGLAFRERAAVAVAAFAQAVGPPGPLRLGHAWSAAGPYTTPLWRRWHEAHPELPLEVLRIDERTAGLTQGRVDVALLRGPVTAPGLVTVELFTEPRVAAVPSDSPLAGRRSLVLTDLAPYPLALNTVSGTTTTDLWPPGAGPGSTRTVANTDDWLAAIAAGLAVGVTARATQDVHPHPGVVYLPLTDAPPLTVSLARRTGPVRPEVAELIALAREVTRAGVSPQGSVR